MNHSMRPPDIARLLILAAIWGASFLFMRIIAHPLGPITTACSRVLIAGTLLCAWFTIAGIRVGWRAHARTYAVIGIVNSAIPFTLYAFAAQHIPASYSAIINALAPAFGMALGAVFLRTHPSRANILGGLLGLVGVGFIAWRGPLELNPMRLLAILAGIAAAACYAIAGTYMKRRAPQLRPLAVAGASQLIAGLALAPLVPLAPPPGPITPLVAALALALALLCSGVAYILYYRVLADCGPTRALTVTYLIPVFGLTWGVIFLNERITSPMMLGAALVIAGTFLVLRAPRAPSPQK